MSAPRIPLYRVVSPLDDANSPEAVQYRSASSYVASLDAAGIPARIVFDRCVSAAEFCQPKEVIVMPRGSNAPHPRSTS